MGGRGGGGGGGGGFRAHLRFQQHEVTRSISTPHPSLDGILVHPRFPSSSTHVYTWTERSTARIKCLAQEHNTMLTARARTRTARSGGERTNHEATAPPRGGAEEGESLFLAS